MWLGVAPATVRQHLQPRFKQHPHCAANWTSSLLSYLGHDLVDPLCINVTWVNVHRLSQGPPEDNSRHDNKGTGTPYATEYLCPCTLSLRIALSRPLAIVTDRHLLPPDYDLLPSPEHGLRSGSAGTEPPAGYATVRPGVLQPIPPTHLPVHAVWEQLQLWEGTSETSGAPPRSRYQALRRRPEIPGGRSSHKNSGKPVRQLLFSEALLQAKGVPPPMVTQPSARHQDMADPAQESTMDRILQEISAVGRRLEGMDNAMVSLAAETKSIRMEIASFQTRVLGVSKVEAHASSFQDRDQELLFLRSKLTDLEDRSRGDNVRFIGFPENIDGEDLHRFLRDTLPRLTGITFEPPL
ncbi:hypothetical protein NDU88_005842 [Pleurodeles waltl]|uniref:Uncharacterized protein n=1 Tax=Pleurodeles waltl TaxID=8319 RepID=A0AAV7WAQ5_PLEWA|nr:hypothetical protein NDU88_005842 [Pleurodeles waltl]